MELHILTNQHLMKFNALNPNDNRQYIPKISTANVVTVNFPIFMSSPTFFFLIILLIISQLGLVLDHHTKAINPHLNHGNDEEIAAQKKQARTYQIVVHRKEAEPDIECASS